MRKLLFIVPVVLLTCALSPEAKAKRIIENGLEDESKTVRVAAARGLAGIDRERSARILSDMLTDADPAVRAAALAALIPHSAQSTELSAALKDLCRDPRPAVRVAAYRNVAAALDTAAKDLLVSGLEDESARVREVAYAALVRFEERDLLRAGLRDRDPLVRIASARALGLLGVAGMSDYMGEEMKRLPPDVLGPAIIMYAELGDTAVLGQLRVLVREAAGELRVDVGEALLILNDRAGVEALENSMESNDPFVRIRATSVLTRHDVPALRARLEAATRDDYVTVAMQAVQALAEHDAENYKNLFAELMEAPKPLLRIAAAAAFLRN
ncbi:HEAT repeat domain-containing protein [candidate division WOR-3 bacterium]|nr:HEAT repeat domain-containing protein [candidate division WOR-3 bacterium]